MTDQHSITPPPELIEDWIELSRPGAVGYADPNKLATLAAQWGANQELEMCCEYLTRCAAWEPEDVQEMRDSLHPKPPSLKNQALQELDTIEGFWDTSDFELKSIEIIRRALKSLPD